MPKIKFLVKVNIQKSYETCKGAAKAILRGNFLALSAYNKKGESLKNWAYKD